MIRVFFLLMFAFLFVGAACRRGDASANMSLGLYILDDRLAVVDRSGQEIVFWKTTKTVTAVYRTENDLLRKIEVENADVHFNESECAVMVPLEGGGELKLRLRDSDELGLFRKVIQEGIVE